jgi:lipid-binding SYLF domain-containing protein
VIPNNVLEKAAGFAIFTVVKAGFLVSARAGSGVVIARLPDGGEFLLPMEMVLMGRLVPT